MQPIQMLNHKHSLLALLIIYVVLRPSLCNAAPNGLNQIPIAKVYGDGGAAFSFANVDEAEHQTVLTSQFGLFNIAEAGIDYQATPSNQQTFLLNGKLLLLHKPGAIPDIAIGIQNVANGQQAVPYLVATTQPKLFGFSLGTIRQTGQNYQVMGGVSYNVNSNLQIVGDSIAGSSNYSTLGIIDNVTSTIQVNVAYAEPNAAAAGHPGYIFNLAYIFHLPNGGISHGRDLSTNGGVIPTGPTTTGGGGKNPASAPATK